MKYICLLLFTSLAAVAEPIKVTLVNPSIPGTPFWDRVTAVAFAAAEDLDIKLSVVYGRDNRIFNHQTIKDIAAQKNIPHFVIFMPYGGNAKNSYAVLNNRRIPFVTMERTLHEHEQEDIGLPQEKYSYWLGEVYHDNIQAGRLLAETLVSYASSEFGKLSLTAIGISGSFSGESEERVEGFLQSINAHRNIQLLQVVPGGWSRERSRDIIHRLSSRYGIINIAWTASDGMALGVLDSVTSLHSPVKNKIITGGIDWTIEALQKIESGEMTASVGGHFMQAAWALVKIYDHVQGKKVFMVGGNAKPYLLGVITPDNISKYMLLSRAIDWHQVDFKDFTLTHGPEEETYNFDFTLVLEQLAASVEATKK